MPWIRTPRSVLVLAVLFHSVPIHASGTIPMSMPVADLAVNPVTDTVFVRHTGAGFADDVTIVDGVAHTTQVVTFPGNVAELAVDPIRNRVYAKLASQPTVVALDVEDLSMQPIPVSGSDLYVDPGADRFYLRDGNTIRAVDGETGAVESYTPPPTLQAVLGVDPIAQALVVAYTFTDSSSYDYTVFEKVGGSPLHAIVTSPAAYGLNLMSGGTIDPFAERAFFTTPYGGVGRYEWASASIVGGGNGGELGTFEQLLIDPARGVVWSEFNDPMGSIGSVVGMNGSDLGYAGVGLLVFQHSFDAWAIQPATRRLYAAEQSLDSFATWLRQTSLDSAGALPTLASGDSGYYEIALNPLTNEIYTLGPSVYPFTTPPDLLELDEPVAAPVPMPTAITPGAPAGGSMTVGFSATSAWVPNAHGIRRIYYQVDSIDGRWLPASPGGATASATITGLAPGAHTLYAFATDGQEATLGKGQTILTGPVASAAITVPAPPACSNGVDDDGDGLLDHPADPGCKTAESMTENPKCDDDLDNDGDGGIDWDGGASAGSPDPHCVATPWRDAERAPVCGVGAELVLVLAALVRMRRRIRIG